MKVVQAVAQILKKEGVDYLIGYPVNPLIEVAAEADIRTIMVRQERTGIHMADAVSRITSGDSVGVFCMQHGPGTENSFGGIAQAYADSVPVVIIPAGYARSLAGISPNFSAFLNFQHISKTCEVVNVPQNAAEALRRAFTQVRNGRPGPAVVEIPGDVFQAECDEPTGYTPPQRHRSAPDPKALELAARTLVAAERPVIYAGQGVHYAKAWKQLQALAELLEAPVTTSLEGKSAFPENHALYLGAGGRTHSRAVHEFLKNSDVIFGVGCSFIATNYGVPMPKGKRVIHSTNDPADLNKSLPSEQALLGDAALTLEMLYDAVKADIKKPRGRAKDIAAQIKGMNDAWYAEWLPKVASTDAPINPYRVIKDLHETVDVANTIITHDAGSPRDQLSPFWNTTEPLTYIGWGKTTQLGYGLGLAMGAKLARPDKLCINFWGDAAIGFTGMDFETAVRERIPIMSVLSNNFSMAIEIPIMQTAEKKYGSTTISGHYADMAKAFGGYGERVTDPAQLKAAFRRGIEATQSGVPALIECITSKEIGYSTFR